jgi:hypothetical protein
MIARNDYYRKMHKNGIKIQIRRVEGKYDIFMPILRENIYKRG